MKLVLEVIAEPNEPLGKTISRMGFIMNSFVNHVNLNDTVQHYVDTSSDQPNGEHYAVLMEAATQADKALGKGIIVQPASNLKTAVIGGRLVIMLQPFVDRSLLSEVGANLVSVGMKE